MVVRGLEEYIALCEAHRTLATKNVSSSVRRSCPFIDDNSAKRNDIYT